MERQLNMASVPIVRYYDHLRFVYEVESRVRELRGDEQPGEKRQPDEQRRKERQPAAPGETKQNPGGKLEQRAGTLARGRGIRVVQPADGDRMSLVETSLIMQSNEHGQPISSAGRAGKGTEYGLRKP